MTIFFFVFYGPEEQIRSHAFGWSLQFLVFVKSSVVKCGIGASAFDKRLNF